MFDQKGNASFFSRYGSRSEEVLEVGAGTGRIAIPLVEQGVQVVCVEPSPAMRDQLRAKLVGRPHLEDRIDVVSDDAASFCLKRTFPVAILSGTHDHLLGYDERLAS